MIEQAFQMGSIRMRSWKLVAATVVIAFTNFGISIAQTWPPPYPTGGDRRVHIAEIYEDRIVVGVPYNFGQGSKEEWEFMQKWADWACGLYGRRAAPVNFNVSDSACDQMGRAAAEQDGKCWHRHTYACAIPPAE